MPNWCDNKIVVRGEEEGDIEQFVSAVAGPNGPLDFEAIKPVPGLLRLFLRALPLANTKSDKM